MQKAVRITGARNYVPRAQVEETGLPIEFGGFPFVYVHYPEGWEFDDELGFLPDLSEIVSKPGVNGVRVVNKRLDATLAYAGAAKKGGTIIDRSDRRLGPWMDYVEEFDVVGGNRHFCFRGCTFQRLPGGKVNAIPNSGELRKFRAYVRDNNITEPINESVVSKLIELEERKLARKIKDARDNIHVAPEIEASRAKLAKMRAAWEALQAPPEVDADPAPAATPAAGPLQLRGRRANLSSAGAATETPGV